jgi:hypothetical protein
MLSCRRFAFLSRALQSAIDYADPDFHIHNTLADLLHLLWLLSIELTV